jgi:hypothetical protein
MHDTTTRTDGYTQLDKGTLLILRAGSGNNIEPTFYFSWAMPGNTGADWYEQNIANCNTTVIRRARTATRNPAT